VELLYDRDDRVIGLRAIDAAAEHACRVRSTTGRDNGPYIISAVAFTRFYEIETRQSIRWEAELDDDVLCIYLDRPGTPVTSNRASNK
jgi:hypothetical protein